MAQLNLAILISGRGSNMAALVEAVGREDFPARIGVVVSNVVGAPGLVRARDAGICTETIDHRSFASRESFEDALTALLAAKEIDLICLAGFMRLLTPHFVNRWRDRVINIHPSLLPAFRGLHVHERVVAAAVRFTGCTVHFVRPSMDDGPIIVQAAVPVCADDDPDTLAARVLASEHQIYPLAVRMIAEGRVRLEGERVLIDGALSPKEALINPLPL